MTAAAALDAYWSGDYAAARALADQSAQSNREREALRALCIVRQIIVGEATNQEPRRDSLESALSCALEPARLEAERHFVRGWLCWVNGDFAGAMPHFKEAIRQSETGQEPTSQAEAAYWLARAHLQTGHTAAVAEFEQRLRTFAGLPRAVCWFVDLLWRGRQPQRAEQVWRAVRGSARTAACEEAFLIDARLLLWRGKHDEAERLLQGATPRNGVLRVERCLYLAMANLLQGRAEEAETLLLQAENGPYPASALRTWRRLLPLRPETAEPPEGTPVVAWRLHQAALALGRDEPATALRWYERAKRDDPGFVGAGDRAAIVQAALPELRQLARAQALVELACLENDLPKATPGLLWGAVQCLDRDVDGLAMLDAAQRGEPTTARKQLETLATRGDLPPEAAHHLALMYLRAAQHTEERSPSDAEAHWHLAWHCWLRWARPATDSDRASLISWLLRLHQQALRDLLARGKVDDARRHWRCVMELPSQVSDDETLRLQFTCRISAFRDELATEYLVMTREAMRYSAGRGKCDMDYETGLTWLTRLLSLDRDNPRLLTEMASICVEWFAECYEKGDLETVGRGVERFTPFALQLARLVEQSEGAELTARAALAEFTKFRGFITQEPARKAALYREALRWHPTNDKVRRLLADGDESP
jgi:tetratricopeptide (TPR) repeat protein